jgi:hypothetical protein
MDRRRGGREHYKVAVGFSKMAHRVGLRSAKLFRVEQLFVENSDFHLELPREL